MAGSRATRAIGRSTPSWPRSQRTGSSRRRRGTRGTLRRRRRGFPGDGSSTTSLRGGTSATTRRSSATTRRSRASWITSARSAAPTAQRESLGEKASCRDGR
eukprot:392518-Pyramimonas_sp.AAC.1